MNWDHWITLWASTINQVSPTFLEVGNGTWFVMSVSIIFTFGHYLIREIWRNGWSRTRLKAALAFCVYFTGSAFYHGAAWLLRYEFHEGQTGIPATIAYVTMGVSIAIALIGGLCVIRTFSPNLWGEKSWVVTVLIVSAVGAVIAMGVW